MKKYSFVIPLVFLPVFFAVGCQDKTAMAELEEFRAQAAIEESHIALVQRYFEAWQKGDLEALKEIFSPEFVWHASYGQNQNLEQTLEFCKEQRIAFPDLDVRIEDIFAKGDKVALRYTFTGTHIGDTEGFPATGKKVESSGVEIDRIENGKIVECREGSDSLSFFQQLGYELKPPEEEK